ncbi:uncharacterized protein BO66DRAFT_128609 [Aspergillus aculeatinus CBS 121060]|uniref:Uncharacterized protein n=1 Tax=Aspergillus aculeatinus CBS 121060 TaxID=1448322 RepID=A0ACD1H4Q2_9EURO|nr:hypothetical protein BO66DRAFT_128609 [Aspergillus aculeatinus CBS 121060]RAH68390.1 hypothetical protein BO66DRAFT_128609 [Aspergillus aculeatinus CBS 121060]
MSFLRLEPRARSIITFTCASVTHSDMPLLICSRSCNCTVPDLSHSVSPLSPIVVPESAAAASFRHRNKSSELRIQGEGKQVS